MLEVREESDFLATDTSPTINMQSGVEVVGTVYDLQEKACVVGASVEQINSNARDNPSATTTDIFTDTAPETNSGIELSRVDVLQKYAFDSDSNNVREEYVLNA